MRTTGRRAGDSRTLKNTEEREKEENKNTDASTVCKCPVCLGYYVNPKILPCGHLVCLQCMLHWVTMGGRERKATCPVCRACILSDDQLNPPDEVEAWPTDLYTEALSKSLQVLEEPHICSTCKNDVTARSYCIPCGIKLCPNCATRHKETPETASHRPKPVDDLSIQTLIKKTRPEMCKIHPDRQAEMYCPQHQQAICFQCRAASHENCECNQAIAEVMRDMIAVLNHRVKNLQVMEKELSHQVSSAKDHIKTLRTKSDNKFRGLQEMLAEQQLKFNRNIQVEEESVMASVTELNNVQAALTQNSSTIGSLVQGASTAALRQMEKALTARLDHLEKRAKETKMVRPAEFILDFCKLIHLEKEIAGLEDCRPSATIRCTVTNISKLEKKVVTPAYMIRNLPWKVVLRRGLQDEHGLYLGFFLECNTESKSIWSCSAKAEFRLLRTRVDKEPFCRSIKYDFSHESSDRGFPRFMPFHVLLDPKKSYVQDDKVTVEVHIEADAPVGPHDRIQLENFENQ